MLTDRKPEHRRGNVQLIDATKWFRPLRKNLGKKNCELGEADIKRICRAFLDFEGSEQSRIFDNRVFGHWKVTVERPLRLLVDLSEDRRERFFDACMEAGEVALGDAVHAVADRMGAGPHRDYGAFEAGVKKELGRKGSRATLTIKRKRLLRDGLADRDEKAEPVVKKVYGPRTGAVADPIRGRFAVEGKRGTPRIVEYEPDTQLRDSEQIPLLKAGGIEGFLKREVLPWASDAWYNEKTVKTGYEISFNRYFYKPMPMRPLEEIRAEIRAVEREAAGLLEGVLH